MAVIKSLVRGCVGASQLLGVEKYIRNVQCLPHSTGVCHKLMPYGLVKHRERSLYWSWPLSLALFPPPPNVWCCRIFKVYICQGKNQKSAGPLIIALKEIGIFNHENYFKFLYVEMWNFKLKYLMTICCTNLNSNISTSMK